MRSILGEWAIRPRNCASFKRFKRLAGPTALELKIAPAKRGKFLLSFTEWALYRDGAIVESAVLPPGAGIAAMTTIMRAANYQSEEIDAVLLSVSRHALVRLAERADVRTVDEMLACIGSLWAVTMALMVAPDDAWLKPPHGGSWQIPVADGVAVLKPNENGLRQLVVVSVLGPEMANDAAVQATMALIAPRTTQRISDARELHGKFYREPQR